MNATSATVKIRRYILISSGEAMVGNFGGLDSSIEITALGSPVNFLSRVDELTKAPEIKSRIQHGDLILCAPTVNLLRELGAPLEFEELNLKDIGLTLRDFPETHLLYRLAPSDENYELLLELHRIGTSVTRGQTYRKLNGK
jgi:class 3 adenylate cyclase